MHPAGMAAFEARRAERTGIYAFEQAPAVLGLALDARLRGDPAAFAFLEAQPAGYRQTVIHWVMDGKQEATRLRRLEKLIEDSAARSARGAVQPPSASGFSQRISLKRAKSVSAEQTVRPCWMARRMWHRSTSAGWLVKHLERFGDAGDAAPRCTKGLR
jgi:hypothetical protein